jgi:anti-sigma regulatory factor (Ser/Thr protein kinase)
MPDIPAVPRLWHFPAEPTSVPRARRAVAEALPAGLPSQLRCDLGLVTSELVTNAIRHGADAHADEVVELVLWCADGHYWLAVSDPGEAVPVAVCAAPGAEGGRGLMLVGAYAAAWGVVPRPVCGKAVVAGLPVGGEEGDGRIAGLARPQ